MPVQLHYKFMPTSIAFRAKGRERCYTLGLSDGQPKVLNWVSKNEGISQKDLAEKCNVRPATMTALLRKMLADDLVYRKSLHAANGKRVFGIFLTDIGRELAEKVDKVTLEVDEIALKDFSEEEKAQFFNFLDRMRANLTE